MSCLNFITIYIVQLAYAAGRLFTLWELSHRGGGCRVAPLDMLCIDAELVTRWINIDLAAILSLFGVYLDLFSRNQNNISG